MTKIASLFFFSVLKIVMLLKTPPILIHASIICSCLLCWQVLYTSFLRYSSSQLYLKKKKKHNVLYNFRFFLQTFNFLLVHVALKFALMDYLKKKKSLMCVQPELFLDSRMSYFLFSEWIIDVIDFCALLRHNLQHHRISP